MTFAVASDGIRLHYDQIGLPSAPPLLMIQGLGADKHLWDLQRYYFATRYRVIAHDNRGAGRSDKPFGAYSLEQMADDAITVLDHAGIDSAHVVGASMGGAITQIIGVKYPDRVRSLSLVCTACRNHPWRRDLLASWAEVAADKGMNAMTMEAARWVIGPRSLRRLWPAVSWLGPIGTSRASHGFKGQVQALLSVDEDIAEQLSTITVPTSVIVGNQDILTPRGDSEELAERIPTAELIVLSGAAHGLMIEHASTFNRVLGDFLKRAEKAYRASTSEADVDIRVAS